MPIFLRQFLEGEGVRLFIGSKARVSGALRVGRHRPVVLIGFVAALATGCGDQSGTQQFYVEPALPDNPTAQTQAAAQEVADREALPVASPVIAVGGSNARGALTTATSTGRLQLTIQMEGLPDASEFAAHVHRGVCAEGGPVAAALNPVVPAMPGTGSSTTTLETAEVPANEPLFVQIHGPSGAPIACGDIVEADS